MIIRLGKYRCFNQLTQGALAADVRKAKLPAIKKEAEEKKEQEGSAKPLITPEVSKGQVKREEAQVSIDRAPDAAELIQEDLSTFNTEMPIKSEDKGTAKVKEEYGACEAEDCKDSQKAAELGVSKGQHLTGSPSKGKSSMDGTNLSILKPPPWDSLGIAILGYTISRLC